MGKGEKCFGEHEDLKLVTTVCVKDGKLSLTHSFIPSFISIQHLLCPSHSAVGARAGTMNKLQPPKSLKPTGIHNKEAGKVSQQGKHRILPGHMTDTSLRPGGEENMSLS